MNKKYYMVSFLLIIMITLTLAACQSQNNEANEANVTAQNENSDTNESPGTNEQAENDEQTDADEAANDEPYAKYLTTDDLVGWASVEAEGVKGVTGGGEAEPQIVTTLAEFKKLAGDDEPRVIVISGTIDTEGSAVNIGSNKTIVGENKDATINGGISITGKSNIMVRNLNIHVWPNPGPVDAVAARGSHHLWFDHLNIWDADDGLMDLTKGSNYITVSWCKFSYTHNNHDHRLAVLIGAGADNGDTDTDKNKATFHHNWFADNVDQRAPRILFGQGHVFNNYYTNENNSYAIGVGVFASVLIENNYFKNVNSPHRFMYPERRPTYITARGNIYEDTTGSNDEGHTDRIRGISFQVEPFVDFPYEYELDAAEDVPELVSQNAGPQ